MNWNDVITVNGQQVKVEPKTGALVTWGEHWNVLRYYDKNQDDGQVTPILPAVPDGLTCWDVLTIQDYCVEYDEGDLPDGQFRQDIHLELEKDCIFTATWRDGILAWCGLSFDPDEILPIEAVARCADKAGALLEWIRVNTREAE